MCGIEGEKATRSVPFAEHVKIPIRKSCKDLARILPLNLQVPYKNLGNLAKNLACAQPENETYSWKDFVDVPGRFLQESSHCIYKVFRECVLNLA